MSGLSIHWHIKQCLIDVSTQLLQVFCQVLIYRETLSNDTILYQNQILDIKTPPMLKERTKVFTSICPYHNGAMRGNPLLIPSWNWVTLWLTLPPSVPCLGPLAVLVFLQFCSQTVSFDGDVMTHLKPPKWPPSLVYKWTGLTFSKLLRKVLGRFLILGKYLSKHESQIRK